MSQIREYPLEHAEVRVEDDLIAICIHGRLEEAQIPQVLQLMHELRQKLPQDRFFLLVDLHETTSLSPAMRRKVAQMMGDFQPAAMGIFGANVEQRGAHALLMGAVAGVSGRRPNTAYFHSETEARQWLLSQRQRLLGTPPTTYGESDDRRK